MTSDPGHIDLINRSLDGELSDAEQAALDQLLAEDASAAALHKELKGLFDTLDSIDEVEPPPHLKHVILQAAQSTRSARRRQTTSESFWESLFGMPALRYTAAFAAGAIITFTFISSDQLSRHAFDDVTGLVGTMSEPIPENGNSITVGTSVVAGKVWMHKKGPIMVIDFDLSSQGPVEIIAGFSDPDIWFNGFAQLESEGATVSAGQGEVRVQMSGNRRYAVYLRHSSDDSATVDLKFFAAGELIHEDRLSL